ncbi:Mg chelatase subunit ChlI [Sporosarcina sp. P18a]|uniref:ATP-binding protein n=1 Tax=Sporosarcina sp. P18a TaxID=2048259 RepID=UPI000C1660FC|nr:ATP-binding protein [Sporosarcina sp. P18a]PIC80020.1 Mg chelatase subunit ChlI [Sporosarcina sp. P18a]
MATIWWEQFKCFVESVDPYCNCKVTISHVKQTVSYPAWFTLIAATNPCPAGYYSSHERYCTCSPKQVTTYQLKVSGPILDRLDFVLSLQSSGLEEKGSTESSLDIGERIHKARELQRIRYGGPVLNGTVTFQQLERTAVLSDIQLQTIGDLCFRYKWSNRTQVKLIRIARTIADLQGSQEITSRALEEAIKWKRFPTGLEVPGGE